MSFLSIAVIAKGYFDSTFSYLEYPAYKRPHSYPHPLLLAAAYSLSIVYRNHAMTRLPMVFTILNLVSALILNYMVLLVHVVAPWSSQDLSSNHWTAEGCQLKIPSMQ
ncbi:hypothetical protein SERLA73DRAFT_186757 [Serpula lacrymans var. lacrymans S7.3]|uniref:Uncharacterized protein n=2 Tax=Serpula lacrymans var. lacrymans TaxID=341189 RepID=F8Q7U7_SERL3|nr:uncharacterized protein SERLADRAFT_475966 [Serpula lacrymans var. lacrymans S7.9]EGN95635.1 hypothetical protein SERLA73DRAFT_186757 [Serpula lacrymans var. lacrymans S7.3]EGO21162.1 hypothetical protein SERLADRAFT_475966 [Serpula lacrymans var. lacrymans S7.9]